MKKRLLLMGGLTSVLMVLIFSVAYAAPVPIDTFDTDPQTIAAITTGVFECSSVVAGSMIGGGRDIQVVRTSGLGTVFADVDTTNPNAYSFNVSSSTSGTGLIQWDGNDGSCVLNPTGLSPLNLDPNDGIAIFVREVDVGATIIMRVYTTGSDYSEFSHTVSNAIIPPGYEAFFPFDLFTDVGAGATFSNVGAIEIEVSGSSLDMAIDLVNSDFTHDYGDLPVAYNITNLPVDGARHVIGDVYLGSDVDSEPDGQESADATGDVVRRDDEDGITYASTPWTDGVGGGSVDVTYFKPGVFKSVCLEGWIDWDNDGSFAQVGDNVVHQQNMTLGSDTIAFDVPAGTFGGVGVLTFNSRWRIYDENNTLDCTDGEPVVNLTGRIVNGEVEDYQWLFNAPTAVSLQNASANSTDTLPTVGIIAIALLAIVGTGAVITRRQRA